MTSKEKEEKMSKPLEITATSHWGSPKRYYLDHSKVKTIEDVAYILGTLNVTWDENHMNFFPKLNNFKKDED